MDNQQKIELFRLAEKKGFKNKFISGIPFVFPIPLSNPKEDLRYFMMLSEILYWLSDEKVTNDLETEIKNKLNELK